VVESSPETFPLAGIEPRLVELRRDVAMSIPPARLEIHEIVRIQFRV